jgi:hypothetical protein
MKGETTTLREVAATRDVGQNPTPVSTGTFCNALSPTLANLLKKRRRHASASFIE